MEKFGGHMLHWYSAGVGLVMFWVAHSVESSAREIVDLHARSTRMLNANGFWLVGMACMFVALLSYAAEKDQ